MKKSVPPIVRQPWERERLFTELDPVSKTHTQHRESVDVNRIMATYDRTGYLPPALPNRVAQYGDVTDLQGDPTELINQSRETLTSAGEHLSKKQKAAQEAAAKKAADDAAELAAFRAEKAAAASTPKA